MVEQKPLLENQPLQAGDQSELVHLGSCDRGLDEQQKIFWFQIGPRQSGVWDYFLVLLIIKYLL